MKDFDVLCVLGITKYTDFSYSMTKYITSLGNSGSTVRFIELDSFQCPDPEPCFIYRVLAVTSALECPTCVLARLPIFLHFAFFLKLFGILVFIFYTKQTLTCAVVIP